jgi:hypothetical protein
MSHSMIYRVRLQPQWKRCNWCSIPLCVTLHRPARAVSFPAVCSRAKTPSAGRGPAARRPR